MTTHQQLQAANLQAIKEALRTREPSFVPSEQFAALTEGSALASREALLAIKRNNPSATPLTNLVYQFHHKIAADENKRFALTEVLMKTAVPQALELDRTVTDANKDEFPLYGFVMGLKESFKKRGTKSTTGMFVMDYVCQENVPFIEWLESKGVVFPVKTNVPQMLFAMESSNNIYGNCQQPQDPLRTSGGSSGGDGCLVALKQVHCALGSDIAGSARIPAAFCGAHSIMFSPSRIDRTAHAMPFEGHELYPKLADAQFGIRATFGVTCRSIQDLVAVSKVIIDFHTIKPRIPPVAWKGVSSAGQPRKIGVLREFDNLMELTLTNRRAMDVARQALTSQGYELVEIDMRDSIVELMTWIATMFGKNKMLINVLKGSPKMEEPLIPAFDSIVQARKVPKWVLKILARVFPDAKTRCFLNAAVNEGKYSTEYVMGRVWAQRSILIQRMREAGVEVLLSPSMMPACFIGKSTDLFPWVSYLNIWNAFGWVAGHFSVTRVREDEQVYNSRFDGKMEKAVREIMVNSKGLPVGIQVVAPEWQDEKVLAVMLDLEKAIKFE